MAKKSKQKQTQSNQTKPSLKAEPWIPMRVGVILMAITSVAMAVLTAWQAIPSQGTVNGILMGVMFGGLIWVIFFGNILINRFLRK